MRAEMDLEQELIDYKLDETFSYELYRKLIDELLLNNRTTGPNQSENYIHYTKMGQQRMKRLDKTVKLLEESTKAVNAIEKDQIWLVLTEAWCGDAGQNIPVIHKMASLNPKVELHLHLRDEQLEIMDQFLTNGGRSIPKLIILDKETLEVLGTWGPRPQELQDMVLQHKANPTMTGEEFAIATQKWYNEDKGESVQREIVELL
ncbi:MAG: thioredoxin family protein [bacterium]|nr:thioredoxin family protein [bacterium]